MKRFVKIVKRLGAVLICFYSLSGVSACLLENGRHEFHEFILMGLVSSDVSSGTNQVATTPHACETGGKCIYVTAGKHDGNFGDVTGGDAFCLSEKPADLTGTYKALLADDTLRKGSLPQAGWVLNANTTYYRYSDQAVIDITDANAQFTFTPISLQNQFSATAALLYWTGLSDVVLNTDTANNCNNWAGTGTGSYGNSTATDVSALKSSTSACATAYHLVCIQQ